MRCAYFIYEYSYLEFNKCLEEFLKDMIREGDSLVDIKYSPVMAASNGDFEHVVSAMVIYDTQVDVHLSTPTA